MSDTDSVILPNARVQVEYRRAVGEAMREYGYTWKQIGFQLGISKQSARYLVVRPTYARDQAPGSEKACSKCEATKPLEQFHKSKRSPDGRMSRCKACSNARANEWKRDNPERHNAKRKRYYQRNRERLAEETRAYHAAFPERKAAHDAVKLAQLRGDLQKQNCSVCGDPNSEAHHDDYTKPLDVVWFCLMHHQYRHIEFRAVGRDPDGGTQ